VFPVTLNQPKIIHRWLIALASGYLESTVWASDQCGFPRAEEELFGGRQPVRVDQDGVEPSVGDQDGDDHEQDGQPECED
jgi:hypothetical protein